MAFRGILASTLNHLILGLSPMSLSRAVVRESKHDSFSRSRGIPLRARTLTDDKLVRVCQDKGSPHQLRAFRELVKRYQPNLDSFLHYSGITEAHIERRAVISEEVWTKIFAHIQTLTKPEDFGVWFFRVARMVSQRELKQTHKHHHSGSARGISQARLPAEISRLSQLSRSVLFLRESEGFSYREIAWIMGLSRSQVRSHLAQGRGELLPQPKLSEFAPSGPLMAISEKAS